MIANANIIKKLTICTAILLSLIASGESIRCYQSGKTGVNPCSTPTAFCAIKQNIADSSIEQYCEASTTVVACTSDSNERKCVCNTDGCNADMQTAGNGSTRALTITGLVIGLAVTAFLYGNQQ